MENISTLRSSVHKANVLGFITSENESIKLDGFDIGIYKSELISIVQLAAKNAFLTIPSLHNITIDAINVEVGLLDNEDRSRWGLPSYSLFYISVIGEAVARKSILTEMLVATNTALSFLLEKLTNLKGNNFGCGAKILKTISHTKQVQHFLKETYNCGIIVCSDSISQGKGVDKSGKLIESILGDYNQNITKSVVVADEVDLIQKAVLNFVDKGCDFVFLTGGTGFGPRDVTTKALSEIIDKRAFGVEEAMRSYGDQRIPMAMLSNSISGLVKETLVVAMPGSRGGVKDCLSAILPMIFHLPHIIKGGGH